MRYFVHVDGDDKITWSPTSQHNLFHNPQDGDALMNSPQTVSRKQTPLEGDLVWELVGGTIAVSPKKGRYIHVAPLEPNTLYEVSSGGIVAHSNMQRGENGFERVSAESTA